MEDLQEGKDLQIVNLYTKLKKGDKRKLAQIILLLFGFGTTSILPPSIHFFIERNSIFL